MIDNGQQDFAMLDLFRSEVATHIQILKNYLHRFESDPTATDTSDKLEPIKQGIHAIWGGAHLVELETVAKMVQAMKHCFLAVQKGEISLLPLHINLLLQSVDLLIQLSKNIQ